MTQITDFNDLQDRYTHIYLSPHLDDAVLSCGGAIVGHRRAGEQVLVVTLCTAAPPTEGPFSPLAQEFHREWALPPDQVVAARLREEAMAMERVDVDYYWVGMIDAIYRYPEPYHSFETLFGAPAADDPLAADLREWLEQLQRRLPNARFYAPLGVGRHVDHLITHAVARDSLADRIAFYEDFPYVTVDGALDQRMSHIDQALEHETIVIDSMLEQKIVAIDAYASQLNILFGGSAAMAQSVTNYAQSLDPVDGTYAERLWRVSS